MQLNSAQQQAVDYFGGPLLVLAGAGSGKTKVITHKIIHLIQNLDIKANRILALTFTNKAAKEMQTRVNTSLKNQAGRGLLITTFHSFGLRFIQQEYQALGFKENVSIYDNNDSINLISEIINSQNLMVNETSSFYYYIISNWKNQAIAAKQALTIATTKDEVLAARIYLDYQQLLQKYNAVDFDDLILTPLQLLSTCENTRTQWQQRYYHILVDEYQDTNATQYQLLKLLAGVSARFTVVGDDHQSIYTWRGALPQNLKLLEQDFPNLKIIKLEQNYRSTNTILKAANQLISHNQHNLYDKNLWSELGEGLNIKVLSCSDHEAEAEIVASEIMQLKFTQNVKFCEIAILYRSNHQARVLEQALRSYHIPYIVSGGTSFFNRSEIKDLIAYLRLINNLEDDASFLRIANVPRRNLGISTLSTLKSYANTRNLSLVAASFEIGLQQQLKPRAYQALSKFVAMLTNLEQLTTEYNGSYILAQLLTQIDYQQWLIDNNQNAQAAEKKWQNIKEFVAWCEKLTKADLSAELSLSELLNKLMLFDILDRQDAAAAADCVNLMTIHTAKGLEFARVFLIGMEEGTLPHQHSESEAALEEERRLAYVAITRAKQQLFISYCNKQKKAREWQDVSPSRFLKELPSELLELQGQQAKSITPQQGRTHLASIKKLLNNSD